MSQAQQILKLPPFEPPWWLGGAHRQTLAAACWFGPLPAYVAVARNVVLDDGDVVVVHDDCPAGWRRGDRAALLMHGLSGSHLSPLLVRIASKLNQRGVRVFRLDLRGCGAGEGLARLPYHAGRSDDLARVVLAIVQWCRDPNPSAPTADISDTAQVPFLSLMGVSLSGNILLKYLGEAPERVPSEVSQAISVNPPIDLSRSVVALRGTLTSWYDRHFVSKLSRDLEIRRLKRPDAPMPAERLRAEPKGLLEFDDWYTAPVSGFATAREYYDRCSANQFMHQIRVPTTVITSCDDPMVPLPLFTSGIDQWSSTVKLAVADGGGHVGYIARRGLDPDEFWLDWRVVDLMTESAGALDR